MGCSTSRAEQGHDHAQQPRILYANGRHVEFGHCVLATLVPMERLGDAGSQGHDALPVTVKFNKHEAHEHTILEIFDRSTGSVHLGHDPDCPFLALDRRGETIASDRPVAVGVVVLLWSRARRSYLCTRRPAHMRTFPSSFVFPGGKCDPSETLPETGIREMFEETGVRVRPASMQPLCLWESGYPTNLKYGKPTRQVLVVFYVAEAEDDDPALNCNPEEVDRVVWLTLPVIDAIAEWGVREAEHEDVQVEALVISEGDPTGLKTEMLRFADLANEYPSQTDTGIARGHKFACERLSKNHPYT